MKMNGKRMRFHEDEKALKCIDILKDMIVDVDSVNRYYFGYYLIITGSLLYAYSTMTSGGDVTLISRVLISFVGIILTFCWRGITIRNWSWHDYFIGRTKELQSRIKVTIMKEKIPFNLYPTTEEGVIKGRSMQVYIKGIYTTFLLFWVALFVYTPLEKIWLISKDIFL